MHRRAPKTQKISQIACARRETRKWLNSADFLIGDTNHIASSKDPLNSSHFFASKTGYNTFRGPERSPCQSFGPFLQGHGLGQSWLLTVIQDSLLNFSNKGQEVCDPPWKCSAN